MAPRRFWGRLSGHLEQRWCPACRMLWTTAESARTKTRCITCRGKTELRDKVWSDGISTLDRAKADLKAVREAYAAEHPKQPRPSRRRTTRAPAGKRKA